MSAPLDSHIVAEPTPLPLESNAAQTEYVSPCGLRRSLKTIDIRYNVQTFRFWYVFSMLQLPFVAKAAHHERSLSIPHRSRQNQIVAELRRLVKRLARAQLPASALGWQLLVLQGTCSSSRWSMAHKMKDLTDGAPVQFREALWCRTQQHYTTHALPQDESPLHAAHEDKSSCEQWIHSPSVMVGAHVDASSPKVRVLLHLFPACITLFPVTTMDINQKRSSSQRTGCGTRSSSAILSYRYSANGTR